MSVLGQTTMLNSSIIPRWKRYDLIQLLSEVKYSTRLGTASIRASAPRSLHAINVVVERVTTRDHVVSIKFATKTSGACVTHTTPQRHANTRPRMLYLDDNVLSPFQIHRPCRRPPSLSLIVPCMLSNAFRAAFRFRLGSHQ